MDFLLQMEILSITEHNFCVVSFPMEDLAREIITNLKLEDRESRLVLVAKGRDYQHPNDSFRTPKYRDVLRIIEPIKNGAIAFKVSYFDNYNNTRGEREWENMEYECEDIDDVVAFVDGSMSAGGLTASLDLYELGHEGRSISRWGLETRSDDSRTRLIQIRGAVKSLSTK